jgi:hypothetical protein
MSGLTDRYSTGSSALDRSVVGFALAPLIGTVIAVSMVTLVAITRLDLKSSAPLREFVCAVLLGSLFGAPLTYIGMFLVGLPTWLLLRFTNNESGLAYTLAGAAGGWVLAPSLGGAKLSAFPLEALGTSAGALSLCLFWLIARRR